MNVSIALRQGVEILEKDSISVPRLTAEVLLAHALRCDRVYLYAHPEHELTDVEQLHYGRYLHERLQRRPTQYITGQQEFYGRPFRVTPAVLIPRPETELLVEEALRRLPEGARVLDVGTGSGCIAVTIQKERPQAVVFASDISAGAMAVAQGNARALEAPVRFFRGDLIEAARSGALDLVVSNPPYIPDGSGLPAEVREYEPAAALFGGPAGLDFYGKLLAGAARVLRPGGWLVVEIGYDMRAKLERLGGAEWDEPVTGQDLAGLDRVMAWQRRHKSIGQE